MVSPGRLGVLIIDNGGRAAYPAGPPTTDDCADCVPVQGLQGVGPGRETCFFDRARAVELKVISPHPLIIMRDQR